MTTQVSSSHRSLPWSVWVILAAMIVSTGIVLARAVGLILGGSGRYIVFFAALSLVATAPYLVGAILLLARLRAAPVVITVAAALRFSEIFFGVEISSLIVAVTSAIVVALVWTPKVRRFVSSRRSALGYESPLGT